MSRSIKTKSMEVLILLFIFFISNFFFLKKKEVYFLQLSISPIKFISIVLSKEFKFEIKRQDMQNIIFFTSTPNSIFTIDTSASLARKICGNTVELKNWTIIQGPIINVDIFSNNKQDILNCAELIKKNFKEGYADQIKRSKYYIQDLLTETQKFNEYLTKFVIGNGNVFLSELKKDCSEIDETFWGRFPLLNSRTFREFCENILHRNVEVERAYDILTTHKEIMNCDQPCLKKNLILLNRNQFNLLEQYRNYLMFKFLQIQEIKKKTIFEKNSEILFDSNNASDIKFEQSEIVEYQKIIYFDIFKSIIFSLTNCLFFIFSKKLIWNLYKKN